MLIGRFNQKPIVGEMIWLKPGIWVMEEHTQPKARQNALTYVLLIDLVVLAGHMLIHRFHDQIDAF